MFPEVCTIISQFVELKPDLQSFILDVELVAFNSENLQVLPFKIYEQRVTQRHSLLNDMSIHLCIIAFDILYLNGESLLNQTFRLRRNKLHSELS